MPTPLKSSNEATKSPAPQATNDTSPPKENVQDENFEGVDFVSKEDASKGEFELLASTIYDIELAEARVETQARYNKPDETEKVLRCTFVINARADGKPIADVTGATFNPGFRKLWDTLSLRSTGFKNNGTEAGKTRACICALAGLDPEKPFRLGALSEIIGKSCKAFVIIATKKDGTKKNKIDKYMTV